MKVELNREFSVDDVKNLDADAFVISTGAFPKIPRIPGVERKNVTTAIDALLGKKEPVSAAVVLMLQDLLNYYKADIRLSSALKEIRENSVLIEKDGSTQELPADTVIMATDFVKNNSLYNALKDSGKEVYVVGDARRSPGNIMRSVADGNEVGRKI